MPMKFPSVIASLRRSRGFVPHQSPNRKSSCGERSVKIGTLGQNDGFVIISRLIDRRAPLIRVDKDWLSASHAGNSVICDEIADEIELHVSAFKAFDRNAGRIEKRHRHNLAPCDLGRRTLTKRLPPQAKRAIGLKLRSDTVLTQDTKRLSRDIVA
jgi:hypothetical protein